MSVVSLIGLFVLCGTALAQTAAPTAAPAPVSASGTSPQPAAAPTAAPTPAPTSLLPQGKCTVNGKDVPCDEAAKQLGGFFGAAIGIFIAWIVIVIAASVFWLMMLIHAASHPIENKALWVVVIVVFNLVGALVYYFAVKRPFTKSMRAAAAGASAPATAGAASGAASIAPPVSPQLAEYIRNSRAAGVADDATRKALVDSGWNPADVDRALKG